MPVWQAYRDDVIFTFRKHKQMAEKAIQQIGDPAFFLKPAEHSNSIAAIIKHLAGNLASRFSDFLTTDGDKPWRDRDDEFLIGPGDTREKLLTSWEEGWWILFRSLDSLKEDDWLKTVRIRGEEHTVLQALSRALTHTAYHVGQITYLARMTKKGEWNWITIPPGKSKEFSAKGGGYLKS